MSVSERHWDVDGSLVERLVADQFPSWASLALSRVQSTGTDNAIFRLGPQLAVRLPMRESAASQAEREQAWLPKLAGALPLAIPAPVGAGRPAADYPWSWSVCPWLEGQDAATARVRNLLETARDLGSFLVALRAIDASGGPAAGRGNHGRGAPLSLLDARVRRDAYTLADEIDAAAVTRAWEEALSAPAHSGPGTWVHGDLHPSNLLVRDGRLSAVIDFGLLGVGDPACDLIIAWSYLDATSRSIFRDAAQADDAMWIRGRGWAIFNSVIALAFYRETNATISTIARRALAELGR